MTNNNRQNKGFLGQIFDNLKEELDKSKEMKENLRKFREEAQKLEDSEALKKARKKFVSIRFFFNFIKLFIFYD